MNNFLLLIEGILLPVYVIAMFCLVFFVIAFLVSTAKVIFAYLRGEIKTFAEAKEIFGIAQNVVKIFVFLALVCVSCFVLIDVGVVKEPGAPFEKVEYTEHFTATAGFGGEESKRAIIELRHDHGSYWVMSLRFAEGFMYIEQSEPFELYDIQNGFEITDCFLADTDFYDHTWKININDVATLKQVAAQSSREIDFETWQELTGKEIDVCGKCNELHHWDELRLYKKVRICEDCYFDKISS